MNELLTSLQNPAVKAAAELKEKKFRERSASFLLEGAKMIKEASVSNWPLVKIFASREALGEEEFLFFQRLAQDQGIAFWSANDAVICKISDAHTPQPIVAVARKVDFQLDSINVPEKTLFLVLDRVADPGNLGTIIRTADALGVGAVLLSEGCADLYSPKTLRSTMGSLFHLPVVLGCGEREIAVWLKERGFCLYVSNMSGKNFSRSDFFGRTAVVMGSEAHGPSAFFHKTADAERSIHMAGRAESLNVAIAAAIIMYQASLVD